MSTATVTNVGRVSYPPDMRPVWQVDTDLPDKSSRSFYLRQDGPCPVIGDEVMWSTSHAWFDGKVARKVGYSFDRDDVPDSPSGHHG